MNAQLPITIGKSPTEIIEIEGALDELLNKVDETINGFTPDLETTKGRKEIASFAQKIARTKTAIDAAGKELTDEWRKKTNEVNEIRRLAREGLDERKEQVRKPLTDWEKEQEELEAKRSGEFQRLVDLSCPSFGETSESIGHRIAQIEAFDLGDWWGRKLEQVQDEHKRALASLQNHFSQAEANEKQAAELAEMKRQQAEEERKRLEAEAKAKEEQEAKERAEREKAEAEERQKREAQLAKEREEQRQRDLAEAEERARKAEQDRIENEKRMEAERENMRRKNAENHARVTSEAAKALAEITGLSKDQSFKVIEQIEAGNVPHVSIKF